MAHGDLNNLTVQHSFTTTCMLSPHLTEHPLVYWPHSTRGTSVKSVQWSPSKPGLFVVLDENSVIYLWYALALSVEEALRKGGVVICS